VLRAVSGDGDVAWALRPTEARDADDGAARADRGTARASRTADRRLVRAAQRGDARALESLFRAHWAMAHRAAYLVVHDAAAAEDIAQEAFLAAVRALERFDRRRPFGPWLHRIVVNRAIDHARARALRREVVLADPIGRADHSDAAAGSLAGPIGRSSSAEGIVEALAVLAPDQRAVVVLRHLLEYTPGEIAALLDLPRGTVNSRLRRGLDALGRALAMQQDDPRSPGREEGSP
jgi:RNA polymerase sigma-70 factor, ECF subfamily